MKKFKSLTALLLVVILTISGCATNHNRLDTDDMDVVAESEETNSTDTSETEKQTEDETEAVDTLPQECYDYDFSIYDDGRTFTSDDIKVQSEFEDYLKKFFVAEMSKSIVNTHFTMEHPEKYGIEDVQVTFGDVIYPDTNEAIASSKEFLDGLMDYNYDSLTYEQQLLYDMITTDLSDELENVKYSVMASVFSPLGGVQGQFPIIFGEYTFLEQSDIDDYIKLLNSSYDYIKKLCDYELYRYSLGYCLTSNSIDTAITQCEDFISTEPNCLRPVFEEQITEFGLSKADIDSYMKKFDEAMENSLIKGYKLIISTLKQIDEENISKGGLGNYENGSDYYEYLVRANTGSSCETEELFDSLKAQMTDYITDIYALYSKYPNIEDEISDFSYPTQDPEKMLNLLIEQLNQDFPEAATKNYSVNYVPKSLESTFTPAFYIVAPIDNISRNYIYINGSEEYANTDLFPTIAHEGYPGHLYQTSYFYNTNPHYFRSMLSYNGYVEGWAHYIETEYSYKYAGMKDYMADFVAINSSFSFALYCLSDIGINYYGWDFEETYDFLKAYIGSNEDVAREIYNTMVDDPGVYLRYYIGYQEILKLRESAMDKLGTGFDIKEFHRFLLEVGPAQFDIIEDRMEDWISRLKGNTN